MSDGNCDSGTQCIWSVLALQLQSVAGPGPGWPTAEGASGGSGGRAIGVAQELGDDVVWRLASGFGDPLEPTDVIPLNTHENAKSRLRTSVVALDEPWVDRCEHGVEVARLRIVSFPGI